MSEVPLYVPFPDKRVKFTMRGVPTLECSSAASQRERNNLNEFHL